MKKIFFLCVSIIISMAAYSQDVIIKKSGEELKVKVLEVGVSEIKYKRYDFQDGPVYSIGKSEVVLVRYENGVNEVINSNTTTPGNTTTTPTTSPSYSPPVTTTQEPTNGTIENNMGSYRQNGRYISKMRVVSLLKNTNDPEILKLLRRSTTQKTIGTTVALGLGLPLLVIGSITTLKGAVMSNGDVVDPDAKGVTTVGATMMGTGLTLQFINIGMQVRSNNLIEEAVAIYNKKYANRSN